MSLLKEAGAGGLDKQMAAGYAFSMKTVNVAETGAMIEPAYSPVMDAVSYFLIPPPPPAFNAG
ncbi:MAG: hypothetical protein LBJ86_03095 [Spirochaetaceae bacterium]|nr:hypothetical protein [Spirochaetaceae bacterium]